MRCFTYTGKNKKPFNNYIDFSNFPGRGPEQKLQTAKLEFLLDPVFDMDYVISCLKSREVSDIYLYGVVSFGLGDSKSSVISEDCFLLQIPIGYVSADTDRSLPLIYSTENKLHLCYSDETFIVDPSTGVMITNVSGNPSVEQGLTQTMNTDTSVVLEL